MLTYQEIAAFCLSLPGAYARYPYGPDTAVFAVGDKKSFCLAAERSTPLHIILKCDPIEAELLRAAYPAVLPGYHCNKRHWNSVYIDGTIPEGEIRRQIQNAYLLAGGRKKETVPLRVIP